MPKRAKAIRLREAPPQSGSSQKRAKLSHADNDIVDVIVVKNANQNAKWDSLPPEIQVEILKSMEAHPGKARAAYAAVCKTWQMYFETFNFRDLVLDNNRINDVEEIVTNNSRRRAVVRSIWLRFELESYECLISCKKEEVAINQKNKDSFAIVLWNLLETLSKWKDHPGILLDIGVKPPDSNTHWDEAATRQTMYPTGEVDARLPPRFGSENNTYDCPHWSPVPSHCECEARHWGGLWWSALWGAAKSLWRDHTGPKWQYFYRVPAVKLVHFRPQYHRIVSGDTLRRLIGYTFETASHFVFEHTEDCGREDLYSLLQVLHHLRKQAPKARCLCVVDLKMNNYKSTDTVLLTNCPVGAPALDIKPEEYFTNKEINSRADIAREMVEKGHSWGLKHCSSFWAIDAFDFFVAIKRFIVKHERRAPLPKLESISLTMPILDHHCTPQQMGDGISGALRLATACLPNLKRVDLWSYIGTDRSRSFVFTWKRQLSGPADYHHQLTFWYDKLMRPQHRTVKSVIEAAELAVEQHAPGHQLQIRYTHTFRGKFNVNPSLGYSLGHDCPNQVLREELVPPPNMILPW